MNGQSIKGVGKGFGRMVSLASLSGQARVEMAEGVRAGRAGRDRPGQDRAKSTAGRMTMKV